MQALTLMIVYVLTLLTTQFFGFLISRLVDYQFPTLGLMTFLILFLAAFGVLLFVPAGNWAWPQGWAFIALLAACSLGFGLWLDAGRLAKGAVADIILFDPGEPWVVNKDLLRSRSKNMNHCGQSPSGFCWRKTRPSRSRKVSKRPKARRSWKSSFQRAARPSERRTSSAKRRCP